MERLCAPGAPSAFASAEVWMGDLLFLSIGIGVFAAFVGYAGALNRI